MAKIKVDNSFSEVLKNQKELYNPSIALSSSPYFITNNWVQLTNFYAHNGFMQTAINTIVDDAFRNDALIIDSATLESEEIEKLKQALEDNGDITAIKNCIKWSMLYGGCCLIANTNRDYKARLSEDFDKLEFIVADRWHCIPQGAMPEDAERYLYTSTPQQTKRLKQTSIEIDASHVFPYVGHETPYYIKQMLNGWGMSIFEPIIPALNQYMEALGVSLELISEAKIDVFKMEGLSNLVSSAQGTEIVKRRLQLVADAKNYTSSIAMDTQDDYQQKQINFSSMPQMMEQLQLLICSALKRPYSKIFGKGGSGLSEQTSDMENYYALVDGEVRTPATRLIKWVVDLRCIQLFGRKLPDFQPEWKQLKILSEKEESEIKSRNLSDLLQLYDRGLLTKRQVAEHLTERDIILFSDEELEKLPDETEEADNAEQLLKSGRH